MHAGFDPFDAATSFFIWKWVIMITECSSKNKFSAQVE